MNYPDYGVILSISCGAYLTLRSRLQVNEQHEEQLHVSSRVSLKVVSTITLLVLLVSLACLRATLYGRSWIFFVLVVVLSGLAAFQIFSYPVSGDARYLLLGQIVGLFLLLRLSPFQQFPGSVLGNDLWYHLSFLYEIANGGQVPAASRYSGFPGLHIIVENHKPLLIGAHAGPPWARRSFARRISELGLEKHVEVAGWIPYYEMPKYINAGKVGLCLLDPWYYSYLVAEPSKVFEIMAYGKPVVATQENLPARLMIKQSNGGILVSHSDVRSTANALVYLFRHDREREQLGTNARKFIEQRRKWDDYRERVFSVYGLSANPTQSCPPCTPGLS